jgi:hypothetical protein
VSTLFFLALLNPLDSTTGGGEEVRPAEADGIPRAFDRGEGIARLAMMSYYILASNWVLKKMFSW